jgi:NAD(P)-dependent dehydrogenase (short-subunit alcohol dehydrogenase family)
MNIKGRTAIITGATGKLVSQIVLSLAAAGANCICIYNSNTLKAKKLAADLRKLKTKTLFIQADLVAEENIEKVFACLEKSAFVKTSADKFPTPQILINAASIFGKKPLKEITYEYISQMFDINFAAQVLMTHKFVELVRKKIKNRAKPLAKIINITDITAQRPPAGFSIYCASKAALLSATKSHAKELAPDFTVNAVSPGIISWQKGVTAEQKKRMLAQVPAGRAGSPAEVADAVKFLIENDYVTGQVIDVDGGRGL